MNDNPTLTSTAVALFVTVGVVALLLSGLAGVLLPALVGIGGALAFAVSLQLLALKRYRTAAAVMASLLTLPVALGLVVGTLGTSLLLVSDFFPVARVDRIAVNILRLVGRVGIVAGCVLAVLGVALGVRNVVDADALQRYFWLATKTSTVPVLVALVGMGGAILTRLASAQPGTTVGTVLGETLAWLVAPGGFGTHVASFLLVVAVAAASVRAALAALPVAELLADSGVGTVEERRVAAARRALGALGLAAVAAGLVAVAVELAMDPLAIRRLVGPGVYRLLVAVTTAQPLRLLAVGAIALTAPVVAGVGLLRRVARGSLQGFLRWAAPVASGAVMTAAALLVAEPTFDWLVDAVAGLLPTVFAARFREVAGSVGLFYGKGTVVVTLVAGLAVVAILVVVGFRLALALGYLSGRMAGFSLASGGLFVASVFAGTIDTPVWVVFGGIVASLLVWDAGEFGTTLGREIGRHARTRGGELTHLGGTLAIGLVGVGGAVGARSLFAGWQVGQSEAAVVALVGVLVGLVLLVASLR